MRTILILLATILLSSWTLAEDAPATQPTTQPTIEVCFVLDTTGSMSGLIDGAKIKIWAVANQIIRTEPRPAVKIAMIGYRDRGDEYITKVFDLTDDIDTVFKNLQGFKADGGGDGPESVNQALGESVTKISWSAGKDVTKIVFLVGDAPPHMDYPNDTKYADVCQAAVKKDLIVNTVQCGADTSCTTAWQEIARLGEGSYVAIPQTGGMVVMATPYDKEMADLNGAINGTVVAYGVAEQRRAVASKLSLSDSAARGVGAGFGGGGGADATASRLAYNHASGKVVQGRGDLLDDVDHDVTKLEDVKAEELPAELQKMTPDELKAHLDKQRAARADLQKKIAEITKKRQDYIDAERKRLEAETGTKDSFDAKVAEIVKEDVARKK